MVYGAFSPSVLGMKSQTQALNIVGTNIANVNTGGYKGSDVRFSTLVGKSMYQESDLSGVRPWEFTRIDQQGLLQASASMMDLGINGRGFFVLSDAFDGSGHTFYGRDGSFQMRTVNDVPAVADDGSAITVRDGYLADKNGYFVMGWAPDANGLFPTSGGALQPLRIDTFAFADNFEPTTTARLGVNLPASAPTGDRQTYSVSMVDSAGDQQVVTFAFRKSHVANQWLMVPETDGVATAQVDTATLSGTPEAGDRYTVTVNGSSFSHTVSTLQTDSVTLSGTPELGDSYTVTVDGTPVTYWVNPTPQQSVVLSGTVEAGDTYTMSIDGTPYSYTAAGGETLTDIRDDLMAQIGASGLPLSVAASGTDGFIVTGDGPGAWGWTSISATDGGGNPDNGIATVPMPPLMTTTLADVRDGLISQINALGLPITAAAGGPDGLTVTANASGTPFVLTAGAADGGGNPDNAAVATSATPLETLEQVRDDLLAQINATLGATVTATATGTDGITLTANAAGTPFSMSGTTVDAGGTADNAIATTTTATVLTFSSHGELLTPPDVPLTLSFACGGTATVDLTVSDMTQYSREFMPLSYSRNGFAAANMEGFVFDENGLVHGTFQDGSTRVLYKVPLAIFSNPNALEASNGNVWKPTGESGAPEIVAAGAAGAGDFMPFSRELSNVDIAEEFSIMIMTQNAYNSSAQVFKTIDEMTTVARDLKR